MYSPVSRDFSTFFFSSSPPKDRTSAIIKNANKTQLRVCPRERETENREGKRIACLYAQKKSFGEMTAYNFVRENKEKEKTKRRDAKKRSEKDNNNLIRHRTQKRIYRLLYT